MTGRPARLASLFQTKITWTQPQALSQYGHELRYLPAHPPSHIVVCMPGIELRKIDGPAIGYQQRLVALREMGWGITPNDVGKNSQFFGCQIGRGLNTPWRASKWHDVGLQSMVLAFHSLPLPPTLSAPENSTAEATI